MTTISQGPALADLLVDIDFPATRDDLLLAARRGGAGVDVMEQLRSLPNESFSGRWAVNRALEANVLFA
jgi:hypothetical protein